MGPVKQIKIIITKMIRIQENKLSNAASSTARYFQAIGKVHDLEHGASVYNTFGVSLMIFHSHWGHMSIIFLWVTGTIFHKGWNGNYEYWITNPVGIQPLGHSLWDPNIPSSTQGDFSLCATSGVYYILLGIGVTSNKGIYSCVILSEVLSLLCVIISKLNSISTDQALKWGSSKFSTVTTSNLESAHMHGMLSRFLSLTSSNGIRLNYHISSLFGLTSLLWSGHIVHCAIPASRGNLGLEAFNTTYSGNEGPTNLQYDAANHVFWN